MSQTVTSDVVAKIRKLLALANDARGNENETAIAASMAQKLMAEYNLELAQLQQDTGTTNHEKREKTETGHAASWPWQVDLMKAVSANNFCYHWVDTVKAARRAGGTVRNRPRHFLLGRAVNVEASRQVYEYLVTALDRIFPEDVVGHRRGISAQSWFQGAVDRLSERLSARRAEAEAESRGRAAAAPTSAGGQALVILTDVYGSEADLNNDALYGLEPGTTAQRRRDDEAARATRLEARKAQRIRDEAELTAEGLAEDIVEALVELMSYGYTRQQAEKVRAERAVRSKQEWEAFKKPETEAERVKREAREERERERDHRRWQKQAARHDSHAYAHGAAAGSKIGLDPQVAAEKKGRLS